jgi:hypothetical protein
MTPLADAGRVIAGRYRLDAPIGRGAMGVVWRARDQLLDRDVAVKEVQMAETLTADERANAYQRTLREAKTAARLSHPGVVSVYDVADDGGRPWIVMELVHARSLDQVLAVEGPLSPRQTAEIGRQLLAALSVAHGAGVLHRDVKPSNVLLCADGRAVLTDFGIATFQGDTKLTQTGMVMGSPGFTAPERIRGGPATPASDLWSLGATLHAAVQGQGPYESRGGVITTMSAIINEDAPAATSAGALAQVISALLRREPQDRPDAASASQMISDVLPLLSDRPMASGGYEPTSLSAAQAGAGDGGVPIAGSPFAPFAPYVETSLDPLGRAGRDTGAGFGGVESPTTPQPSPTATGQSASLWADPGPGLPAGMGTGQPAGAGQPAAGLGAGLGAGQATPDFSSWYSPRPGERGSSGSGWPQATPEYPPPRGYPSAGSAGSAGSQQAYAGSEAPGYTSAYPPGSVPGRARRQSGSRWKLVLVALALIGAGAGAATVMLLRHSNTTTPAAHTSTPPSGSGSTAGPLSVVTAINYPLSGPLPSGYTTYSQAASVAGTTAGYSLAYPSSWNKVQPASDQYQTYLKDPSVNAFVLMDLTHHTHPQNMIKEAIYIRNNSVSSHPGYFQMAIARLDIRGNPGAYWQFTYLDNGVRQEVVDLLWVGQTSAGPQSYAMYFTAPESLWNRFRPEFIDEARSFATLPS